MNKHNRCVNFFAENFTN